VEIFSPYIIAPVAGWIIAQLAKYLISSIKGRSFKNIRQLYLSGSMPSAHSATVISLLIVVGVKDGLDSAVFAIALVFASVVLYDSMMVRRSSGEQGVSLTKLIKEQKSKVSLPRVAKGHTPAEVTAGALLGIVVGIVVALFV
jgi:acid phosphatase family membrane protein YuiD